MSKRGVVLVLSVAFSVAFAKTGHNLDFGFFDGPR